MTFDHDQELEESSRVDAQQHEESSQAHTSGPCDILMARAQASECYWPEACEQAKRLKQVHEFTFELAGETALERSRCVAAWLETEGLEPVVDGDGEFVSVVAIWEQVEFLINSAAIEGTLLGCSASGAGSCEHCRELVESDCVEDTFCSAFDGVRWDSEHGAYSSTPAFVGCVPQAGCGDVGEGEFRGPDGECYQISGIEGRCQIAGYEDDSTCTNLLDVE